MASQDFPLIPDPHKPTRLPQTSDSTATNADYYANPTFTPTEDSDPDRSGSGSGSKRNPYYYKKQKTGNNNSGSSGGGGGNNNETASEYRVDYRKDREEWSDTAIACLLEAYTEKFNQLNRGNLRGRDWEEVAEAVSERCAGGSFSGENSNDKQQQKAWKSVEQCKNKIDNLKKRYKVELQRLNSSGGVNSNWHWFKQMEVIVGSNNTSNLVTKSAGSGGAAGAIETVERNAGGGAEAISSPFTRQTKRYTSSNAPVSNNLKPKPQQTLKWRRVVFKISGSALAGAGLAGNCQNVDAKLVMQIAGEVATACRLGVEVAIVVGGRNFFCGDSWVSATSLDRPTAYQIGMTATVMNALLLQSALEKMFVPTRVQSAFSLPEFVEPYSRQRAIRHLEKGRVVIFGGVGAGTGNPLFTTDTAAALRACEINADVVLKGTNVSGVCDYQNRKFEHITFRDVVSGNFTPMDAMALTYCEENRIPVVVFSLLEPGNVSRALSGDPVGTLIDQEGRSV